MDKLEKIMRKHKITTITLDVFDTVLLRDTWPEDIQFLEVAERWLPFFNESISKEITAYQLYSWRQYVRKEIIESHYSYQPRHDELCDYEYDTNLTEWFTGIIESLCRLYNKKGSVNKSSLLAKMIEIELGVEATHLRPNHKVINAIKQVKSSHPEIRVFFVSDMYLSSKDIGVLLKHFSITIFDDGISSSDALCSKVNKNLFYYLEEHDPFGVNFELCNNIHLGDNPISDFKNARRSGSYAIKTPIGIARKAKTAFGEMALHHIKDRHIKLDKQKTRDLRELNTESFEDFWYCYGLLFSQPLYSFLFHLDYSSRYSSSDTEFIAVSSEASFFYEISKQHFGDLLTYNNFKVANKLNRKCMIRALLWAYLEGNVDINAHPIFNTICLGETEGTRYEIYQFIFGKDYPVSELVLNLRSEKEFFKALVKEIKKTQNTKYLQDLKESYVYAKSFLPKNHALNIVIADVGWGGTVQVLFEAFAKIHGHTGDVRGLYLGSYPDPNRFAVKHVSLDAYLIPDVLNSKNRKLFNAVMWEYAYTNKAQFPGDKTRLKCIRAGIGDGAALFRKIETSPKIYFDKIIAKYLERLVGNPTRREVALIGDIEFDCGFINKGKFKIVNTGYSQVEFWKMLLAHPRMTIRDIIFKRNCWPSGYISYYRIRPLKWALRIYGKLRHRYYL